MGRKMTSAQSKFFHLWWRLRNLSWVATYLTPARSVTKISIFGDTLLSRLNSPMLPMASNAKI